MCIYIYICISPIPKKKHKGPYGPIWAHMGPNPDQAPTRTGPQDSEREGVRDRERDRERERETYLYIYRERERERESERQRKREIEREREREA